MSIEKLADARTYLDSLEKNKYNDYLKEKFDNELKEEIVLNYYQNKMEYVLNEADIKAISNDCSKYCLDITEDEIKEIFARKFPRKYFVVQAYKNEVDEKYHCHLLPNYLTSYNMELGGSSFGLQSGLHDALKFTSEETAIKWKNYAKDKFLNRSWEIVEIDERLLGKYKPLYVL